jgi:tetratricopeptide (TPR) repeat protein
MKKQTKNNRRLLNLFVLTTKASVFLAVLLGTWAMANPLGPTQARVPFLSISEHYTQLESFWMKKLKADPFSKIAPIKYAEAKVSLARATGDESHYRMAERTLRESIKRQPRYAPELETKLAVVLMSRHKFHEALRIADKAYGTTKSLDSLIVRGDAHLGLGNYKEARNDFETLVDTQPDYTSWVRLAHVLELYGEKEKALGLFHKAKESYRGDGLEPAAWIRLRIGIYYLKQMKLVEAEEWFRKSMEIAPDYYLAQEHLAEVYELRQEPRLALPLLEAAINTKRDPLLLMRLADVMNEVGQTKKAEELESEAMLALETNATGSSAHYRDLAEALVEQGRELVRARRLAHADWLTRPGDITANLLLGKTHRITGDFKRARLFLNRAAALGQTEEIAEELKLLDAVS